jgi:putative transposase
MKKSKTSTFLLEVPLQVAPSQAKRLRAHLEAARCLYNALLSEALTRLRHMRADPAWQQARALPSTQKQQRAAAFSRLRHAYGFSEYDLHHFAIQANATWIAEHIDAVTAQTLATRAYQAVNRVCLGKARSVRFRSRGRGLDSVEGKRSDTGLRFVLQRPREGNQGHLLWGKDRASLRLSTGTTLSSNTASPSASSTHACCDGKPPVHKPKAPIARGSATSCS